MTDVRRGNIVTRTIHLPPPTPIEPVSDIFYGIAVTDPYRWLEDQTSPRTRQWLDEQSAYTRSYLDELPGRDRIRKRVEELLSVQAISAPIRVGRRYFYMKRLPNQEQPVIMMREGEYGDEVVLVDPKRGGDRSATTVKILNVSKNGRLLAYAVSEGADSFRTTELIDVDRRQILPDYLPRSCNVQVQFSPDEEGFYYSCEPVDTLRPHYRAAYWHQLGSKSQEDREIFFAGESPTTHLTLYASADGRTLGYLVAQTSDSTAFDFYVHNPRRKDSISKIVEQVKPLFCPFFAGDRLYALTDWKAPNFRLVNININSPGCEKWVDIVPESRCRIKDFAFAGKFVFVGYVENAVSRIEIFDITGRRRGSVPCPPHGGAQLLWRPQENDTLFYSYSSFDYPPTIFSYHVPTNEQRVWAQNPVKVDSAPFDMEQIFYKSKDGTQIPMFLVARKGLRFSDPLPTFLTAYGGFGASRTPQFNAYSTFLIERGFLFAFATLRGGGEFGTEWHRAAQRHNRQNAFDDFIAAAEWLIAEGHSTPDKIAIGGGSNAGLLAGVALTQRPDLFRSVICMGPLLDMLRYHRFDKAHMFVDEYGTAEREDDFLHLFAYSPYHHVRNECVYPSVMFISGDQDTCCNPMHARKMTALMQAATNCGRPIILDYKPKWGHIPVQPLSARIDALTDRLAFICHELDVEV